MTIKKNIFIIYNKLNMKAKDNLVRDFEIEKHTLILTEKQIKREDREKEFDMER